ncbi:MAG: recombination protein O N-terminal domain-containing protein [Muribaculaceae bacterium]|nr:recombination protein O N-terminal domain-containing protein [Muribaculaceae bacterium]
MFKELHCVALRTVRYSDRSSILSVYSQECGRMSLSVPAGNGRGAARIRALTMPMSSFECVAIVKPGQEISNFKDLKCDPDSILSQTNSMFRNAQAFFLSDFFNTLLREPLPDEKMWRVVHDTSRLLSVTEGSRLSNFHILTLIKVGRVLGIEPDTMTGGPGKILDLQEGVWRRSLPTGHRYFLSAEDSMSAIKLLRMNPRNFDKFKFSHVDRNRITENILDYFTLHGFPTKDIASLMVLKELF